MNLSVDQLTTDRKWRASLGLDKRRFEILLERFEQSYQTVFGKSLEERLSSNPKDDSSIRTYEELLFFTLFSLKSGLTYDLLGLVTGMEGSSAQRYQQTGIKVLRESLRIDGHLPRRSFSSVKAFKEHFAEHKTLILDGVEQRTQRPEDNEEQRKNYSGKKKGTP